MEFYNKVNDMVIALKDTPEYERYIILKNLIKTDISKSKILKEFKEKQKSIQVEFIRNNGIIDNTKKESMEKLFNIIVKDDQIKEFLDLEIKLDMMLAEMQKIIAEGIKEINEF